MDSKTGNIISITQQEAYLAEKEKLAWEAGLLKHKPRHLLIKKHNITSTLSSKRSKKERSYKDFCR